MSANIYRVLMHVEYPDDVRALRQLIPALSVFDDSQVERLYRAFSADRCASWLSVSPSLAAEFAAWLGQ